MSKTKARILMMIDQFYPVIGGAESQALRLSMNLIEKGHKVLVLTRKVEEGLAAKEGLDGIEINRLPILGVSGKSKLKSIIPATKWLINNKDEYDIIHCHGVNPLEWAAYFSSMFTKKPYVVKIPLSNYLNYAGAQKGVQMQSVESGSYVRKIIRPAMLPALRFIRKRFIGQASRVFAISPEIQKRLKSNNFRNIVHIPNGIDTDKFCPINVEAKRNLRSKLNLSHEKVIFVYSGRLSQEKNLHTLLSGWNKFKGSSEYINCQLILLGGGKHQSYTCESELRNYVLEKKLNSINFQGQVSNVVEYLQASDVFILPSLWEGMSNSLLEAMSCGIPALVSDIPGNRALVESEKSGLFFETTNVDALCDYLKDMSNDSPLRQAMGERARKIALEKYSFNVVIEDIIEEYNNILNIVSN